MGLKKKIKIQLLLMKQKSGKDPGAKAEIMTY